MFQGAGWLSASDRGGRHVGYGGQAGPYVCLYICPISVQSSEEVWMTLYQSRCYFFLTTECCEHGENMPDKKRLKWTFTNCWLLKGGVY